MPFFDSTGPPPEPPPDYRAPEWIAPPENVIPVTVALNAVLVRRPDLAIWIAHALVFPTGATFGLSVQRRERSEHHPPFFGPGEPDGPRFGIQLAGGEKVVVERFDERRPFLERPDRSTLRPVGGSGGGHVTRTTMWLWPLPPEGPLTFVCEWPAEGVEEVSAQVDASPLRAAAARAVEVWPDDRPLPPREDDVVF